MRAISNLDAELLDAAAWDSFVAASPHGHLLQTSRWGALKARFACGVERVALTDGDTIVAGAQVLYRSLPFGLTLAYVPKGPLVDWDDEKAVHARPNDELNFAQHIAALMDDPERRKKMGQIGRERIEAELAWPCQEKFLLEAYEALVSQADGGWQ